ncbi:MAG: patatin-like phospholipase family protein [Nitrospirae bacterium]|nr:patatin-like phospholipase family protein [Nitrospirota bacterium]
MYNCKNPYKHLAVILLLLFVFSCATREEIKRDQKPAKIAVVLGAGASRGFAHIGVLKVLEANKVPVHMIVGTSAGSFVGSLYAYGYTAFQLQDIALAIERSDIIDFGIPDKGFIKGDSLQDFINSKVGNTPIEDLKIPFYAVTTDIMDGSEAIFSSGDTGIAVRASCSIPGIFRPVMIGDRLYADGGIVSPVAVDAARQLGADVVIAVDISSDVDLSVPEGTIDMILKSVTIMHAQIAATRLSHADIVIRPKVGHIGSSDFTRRHEAVLEGEKAATEALPEIHDLISVLRHDGRL